MLRSCLRMMAKGSLYGTSFRYSVRFSRRFCCSRAFADNWASEFYHEFQQCLAVYVPAFDGEEPLHSQPFQQALKPFRAPPVVREASGHFVVTDKNEAEELFALAKQPHWLQFNALYHLLRHPEFLLGTVSDPPAGPYRYSGEPKKEKVGRLHFDEDFSAVVAFSSTEAMSRANYDEGVTSVSGIQLASHLFVNGEIYGLHVDDGVTPLQAIFSPKATEQMVPLIKKFQIQSGLHFLQMLENGKERKEALRQSGLMEFVPAEQIGCADPTASCFKASYFVLDAGDGTLVSNNSDVLESPRGLLVFTDYDLAARFLWRHLLPYSTDKNKRLPEVEVIFGEELWNMVKRNPYGATIDFKFINDQKGIHLSPDSSWLERGVALMA